jgi:nucleotide-binding universal stress UspA family protein
MQIRDMIVHIDSSRASDVRVGLAVNLARRFGAYITGVFILPTTDLLVVPPDSGPAAVALVAKMVELEEAAKAAEATFRGMLTQQDLAGDWRVENGTAESIITRRARETDLVVIGQHDPDDPGPLIAPEDVILGCGRPVLMVPYAGHFEQVGSTVLVAWNNSREATRALHDSLSLMATTSTLTVMTVIRNVGEEQDDESRGELVRHLARHGLTARSETSMAQEGDTAGVVLSQVADLTADLLVMGAYGHSRLRETILGGMTRDILEHMTVPVLMAH